MRHHKYRTSAHSIACPCSSNNVKPPNCSHTPSSSLFPGIYLECNQISKYKTNEPLNSILNTITTSGLNLDSQSGIMCSCERGYILVTHNVPHEKVPLQYHNTPASTLLLISPDSICWLKKWLEVEEPSPPRAFPKDEKLSLEEFIFTSQMQILKRLLPLSPHRGQAVVNEKVATSQNK